MPEIVVVRALGLRQTQLAAVCVVGVAIDESPQGLGIGWPLAGEDAEVTRWDMRLPVRSDQLRGEYAFDCGDAAQSLGVARGHLIPDAPDVFPAFEADAVEEGLLQVVEIIVVPAIG